MLFYTSFKEVFLFLTKCLSGVLYLYSGEMWISMGITAKSGDN